MMDSASRCVCSVGGSAVSFRHTYSRVEGGERTDVFPVGFTFANVKCKHIIP